MHDSYAMTDHKDTITRIYADEIIAAFDEQMQEAERLAGELHNLLKDYEAMVEREGSPDRMETLVHWAERYTSGLSAASRISRNGQALLRGLGQRLKPESSASDSLKPKAIERGRDSLDAISPFQPKSFTGAARQIGKITSPAEYGRDLFPIRRFRGR